MVVAQLVRASGCDPEDGGSSPLDHPKASNWLDHTSISKETSRFESWSPCRGIAAQQPRGMAELVDALASKASFTASLIQFLGCLQFSRCRMSS